MATMVAPKAHARPATCMAAQIIIVWGLVWKSRALTGIGA